MSYTRNTTPTVRSISGSLGPLSLDLAGRVQRRRAATPPRAPLASGALQHRVRTIVNANTITAADSALTADEALQLMALQHSTVSFAYVIASREVKYYGNKTQRLYDTRLRAAAMEARHVDDASA